MRRPVAMETTSSERFRWSVRVGFERCWTRDETWPDRRRLCDRLGRRVARRFDSIARTTTLLYEWLLAADATELIVRLKYGRIEVTTELNVQRLVQLHFQQFNGLSESVGYVCPVRRVDRSSSSSSYSDF